MSKGEPVSLSQLQMEKQSADGFKCPDCGCRELPVGRTRKVRGRKIRYRYCRNCGKGVQTVEKVIK